MNTIDNIREILLLESQAIIDIPLSDDYESLVKHIYFKVNTMGGKIITCGVGKAGQIALNIATTLSSIGVPAIFIHPTEALHGDLGVLQNNDTIILVLYYTINGENK